MRAAIASCLSALLFLLLGLAPAQAEESYVRWQRGDASDSGALQTAVATFTHPDTRVEVILYGVVHVADAAYYRQVQTDLDGYDVVLYEGVAPPQDKAQARQQAEDLKDLQQTMGEVLGLTFQKDGIDYTRANLVHADMTLDQLQEAMGGKDQSPLDQLFGGAQFKQLMPMLRALGPMAKAMMANNPAMQDRLKMMMAQQLAHADLGAQLGENFKRVILERRNEVAMEVLAEQLQHRDHGRIAIFYGAAHNPDFEERLGKLGWTRSDKRWMSAWSVGQSQDEPAPTPRRRRRPLEPATAPSGKKAWY